VATVSSLGRGADLTVPLADLLQLAIGPAGRAVAAAARAGPHGPGRSTPYVLGGVRDAARSLTAGNPVNKAPNGPGRPPHLSAHALLGVIALAGLLLIGLSALRLADHHCPGQRADRDVPVRLPHLHRVRDPAS